VQSVESQSIDCERNHWRFNMAISFRESVELERPAVDHSHLSFLDRLLRPRAVRPIKDARPAVAPSKPSKPTEIDCLSVLVSKHGFSEVQAKNLIAMLVRVRDTKISTGRPYVLSGHDLGHVHGLLLYTIPARSKAEPGSTHELLNRALLEEGQSFVHGTTGDQCSVLVSVR
jgi:hypothetical protein